jgi:hypothetical protein
MLTVREALQSDLRRIPHELMSRQMGRVLAMQLGGEAFALERDGELVMAGGRWPLNGYAEIWLMTTPALENPFLLARALKIGRDQFLRRWNRPDMPLTAAVQDGHEPGLRLGRLAGFVDTGPHPEYPGCQLLVFVDAPLRA